MKETSILVAGEYVLFRKAMVQLLLTFPYTKICREASSASELMETLKTSRVHIVVLFVEGLSDMNGYEIARFLKKEYPSVAVIALARHSSRIIYLNMLKFGVKSILAGHHNAEDLRMAIERVMIGGIYIPAEVEKTLAENLSLLSDLPAVCFSEKERLLIKLLKEGKSNKEIASSMGLAVNSINTYQQRLCLKTKTKDKSSLIAYLYQNNICLQ